ncbi:MAG TPA: hypothetical protein VNZ64_26360 [Candidatus Acidoferrum sp.]|nr:hypothetical protein [Candidatus Acidoferrum sp.]
MSTLISPISQRSSIATRLLCVGGAIVTMSLLYLGGIWPSLYTLIAIPALPSSILFLATAVRPALIRDHRFLRYYLIGSSFVAGATWLFDIWWLSRAR